MLGHGLGWFWPYGGAGLPLGLSGRGIVVLVGEEERSRLCRCR